MTLCTVVGFMYIVVYSSEERFSYRSIKVYATRLEGCSEDTVNNNNNNNNSNNNNNM